MPRIIPIVEGQGDAEAVPILLRKILADSQCWDWKVGPSKRAGDLSALRRNLSSFLQRSQLEPDCRGILILLDLDDGCPQTEARSLATEVRKFNLACPVAIVLAYREYEAWFLASLSTIAGNGELPPGLSYDRDVEGLRGVKEWLSDQMPRGRSYTPTTHQASFTALIDLDLARQNSRSFRRLCHAVEELILNANAQQQGHVTPLISNL